MIVESSGLSPRLEQVRRAILARHASRVASVLESHPRIFATPDPAIAARCLVGAVSESLHTWLETEESQRRPVEDVARLTAEYNLNAVKARG
jgi:hypothetical protein